MVVYKVNSSKPEDIEIPFELNLSFKKLFKYWEEMASQPEAGMAAYGKEVLRKLERAKVLREPIKDLEILEEYPEELPLLLSAAFPSILSTNEIKSAGIPFHSAFFNPTARFKKILDDIPEGYQIPLHEFDADIMYINACVFIINVMYKRNIDFQRPFFMNIPDAKGSVRYYRVFINADFADVLPLNPDFKLSEEELDELVDNFDNIDLWKEKIPPKTFAFEGFALLSLFDVSIDQVLSQLKDDLLKPDALQNKVLFEQVEQRLQFLFNIPDLQFGYAFVSDEDGEISALGNVSRSLIHAENNVIGMEEIFFTEQQKLQLKEFKPLALSNLTKIYENKENALLKKLIDRGIDSYIMAPIRGVDGEFIGILELGAPLKGQLNTILLNRLEEILPLFTIALQRNFNDYNTRLEAIIQEQCTSIHPSVSWRFFEEAAEYFNALQNGQPAAMNDIAFENVYPLYGQADIRGSSTERNRSIQEDMLEQLGLAEHVVKEAEEELKLPILNELIYRIADFSMGLQSGLNAGDEINILDFLKQKVYPVFRHLRTLSTSIRQLVDDYEQKLDPELGMVYKKRKLYERSVSMLNEKISQYVELQQVEAQRMFPHYFEKYKTDGVEFNIYIGQSLVKHKQFNELYLHNLRLWQLITICGVENLMYNLKPEMPVPLDVASLILVHSSPLSIQFRMAEKRFDVDGAYNVRYEIIKKRIDKASIKGKKERLTQPGKIAIVYSQDHDADEYKRYLTYLHSINLIEEEVEMLDLEDLQGATGLKALRVKVVYQKNKEDKRPRQFRTKKISSLVNK